MIDQRTLRVLLDESRTPSPCFVVDESLLEQNAALLDVIQQRTGAKILLALKGFAMWSLFPLLSREKGGGPLWGVCASSPDEARLGREEFGGEVHAFAAAWSDADMAEVLRHADHVTFNSLAQWKRFRDMARSHRRPVECGLRVNPEHSEGAVDIYNPCAPASRLGIRQRHLEEGLEREPFLREGLTGLHFHTLCEQGADALERTLAVFERRFGRYLEGMRWINMGGGHHITKPGYDVDLLCRCIEGVKKRHGVGVYLEPGEAVALNAGWLVTTVLDVLEADMPVAVLDASASAHMPDVLEMPYRPGVIGAGEDGKKLWRCRLAGKSCLAGDVVGVYSFDAPLQVGQRIIFTDMAHYSMVKTTTFNGLRLPGIAAWRPEEDSLRIVREFGYEDFKGRLS